ncbi:hypothetical protein Scep_017592 [Stephania cephalantha]|uniref:Uncharacterized protein n=1 Tax=Stephania cephalantha TaxID=152367 RepID=A0AAP0NV36_9MAGN
MTWQGLVMWNATWRVARRAGVWGRHIFKLATSRSTLLDLGSAISSHHFFQTLKL